MMVMLMMLLLMMMAVSVQKVQTKLAFMLFIQLLKIGSL